jgi:hypothetical protein
MVAKSLYDKSKIIEMALVRIPNNAVIVATVQRICKRLVLKNGDFFHGAFANFGRYLNIFSFFAS